MNQRIKKATHLGRHLLPSGKFYYELYQDKHGLYFSDPETFNCDSLDELKDMINAKPGIEIKGTEHMARMQECQQNLVKHQEYKNG